MKAQHRTRSPSVRFVSDEATQSQQQPQQQQQASDNSPPAWAQALIAAHPDIRQSGAWQAPAATATAAAPTAAELATAQQLPQLLQKLQKTQEKLESRDASARKYKVYLLQHAQHSVNAPALHNTTWAAMSISSLNGRVLEGGPQCLGRLPWLRCEAHRLLLHTAKPTERPVLCPVVCHAHQLPAYLLYSHCSTSPRPLQPTSVSAQPLAVLCLGKLLATRQSPQSTASCSKTGHACLCLQELEHTKFAITASLLSIMQPVLQLNDAHSQHLMVCTCCQNMV